MAVVSEGGKMAVVSEGGKMAVVSEGGKKILPEIAKALLRVPFPERSSFWRSEDARCQSLLAQFHRNPEIFLPSALTAVPASKRKLHAIFVTPEVDAVADGKLYRKCDTNANAIPALVRRYKQPRLAVFTWSELYMSVRGSEMMVSSACGACVASVCFLSWTLVIQTYQGSPSFTYKVHLEKQDANRAGAAADWSKDVQSRVRTSGRRRCEADDVS
ncbi:unnamed protein product [Cyprideis torosa]|uniref:Uncharacterized protein n=1 Tax=Cyprideis torosa TaxID=163714 RepID=A0A7R8ZLU9_9CRUS|nr:unnamed protein product [Cyprideis torosa]CAG0882942.1 unnamed protein product [Cyprideis torosa]